MRVRPSFQTVLPLMASMAATLPCKQGEGKVSGSACEVWSGVCAAAASWQTKSFRDDESMARFTFGVPCHSTRDDPM